MLFLNKYLQGISNCTFISLLKKYLSIISKKNSSYIGSEIMLHNIWLRIDKKWPIVDCGTQCSAVGCQCHGGEILKLRIAIKYND